MTKLQLKVCGMRDAQNIAQIDSLAPDYLGFIFYPQSKRYVGDNFSWDAANNISSSVKKVGVFVKESTTQINRIVRSLQLDIIQLHGGESTVAIQKIKALLPCTHIWKVFSLQDSLPPDMDEYASLCDLFLFDTKTKEYGGTGKSFDWSLLYNYNRTTPFFLSGGIGIHNIKEALLLAKHNKQMVGIDINSKAEIAPGIKSYEIVKQITEEITK